MNSKQDDVYETMEKRFLMGIYRRLKTGEELEEILVAPNTIAQLIRLRQICLSPAMVGGVADSAKLDALRDLLLEDLSGQVIVYSCFRRFLPMVAELLKEDPSLTYAYLVGGQTAAERALVQQRLADGSIRVVLGTIQSMGEGMNLQAADTAVFCDIDWVPAVNVQAEDRIHRVGIQKSPCIIRLYHPDTVEEDIRAACKRKERIVQESLGKVEGARNSAELALREMLQRRGFQQL
jgi:SNF2 family DNA or RNA helicase